MRSLDIRELISLLLEPECLPMQPAGFWSDAMPRLRRSGLLGRLAVLADPGWRRLPTPVRDQFQAALTVAQRQRVLIERETQILGDVLAGLPDAPVLLKGAAYQALDLPNAPGRLSSDIDIMVPKAVIERVEQRLLNAGFVHVNRSTYDQRYYREWMHELPPLRHVERGSFVDLHHSIVAETSRLHFDPRLLFEGSQPIPGCAFRALGPNDLILHSVCHLLTDGEFPHGLRDLFDLRDLLGTLVAGEAGWATLLGRADQLGLTRLLHYVIAALERWDLLEVPGTARDRLRQAAPPWPADALMQVLIGRTVVDWNRDTLLDRLASTAMLARSHLLRMPLGLLIPHLARKSWRRLVPETAG